MMHSPSIAVVLKGYPRLSETFIAQELRGLEREGFKLRFFALRRPTDSKRHPIHDEIEAPVVYLPEYLHHEPLRVARAVWRLVRRPSFRLAAAAFFSDLRRDLSRHRVRRYGQACVLAAELPAEVAQLYAHFIHTPAAVTRYAAILTGMPWACSAHAKDIWTSPEWDLERSLTSAEWVATCTEVGHRHLARIAGTKGIVHLLYHGLDLDRFPPRPAEHPVRPRDGGDSADPVRLVCVGRAVEKKGIDTLLRALAQLPDDLHCTMDHIGGGAETGRLAALSLSLGIADRVRWHGAQDQQQVLAAYRGADLFVLPCRIGDDGDRDGLPNVLVEAQSQRVACISTHVSAVPELVTDGETGVLVQPDDPEALARAITKLARDPSLRSRLAEAGEARVRRSFDYRSSVSRLAALFPPALRDAGGSGSASPVDAGSRLAAPCCTKVAAP